MEALEIERLEDQVGSIQDAEFVNGDFKYLQRDDLVKIYKYANSNDIPTYATDLVAHDAKSLGRHILAMGEAQIGDLFDDILDNGLEYPHVSLLGARVRYDSLVPVGEVHLVAQPEFGGKLIGKVVTKFS